MSIHSRIYCKAVNACILTLALLCVSNAPFEKECLFSGPTNAIIAHKLARRRTDNIPIKKADACLNLFDPEEDACAVCMQTFKYPGTVRDVECQEGKACPHNDSVFAACYLCVPLEKSKTNKCPLCRAPGRQVISAAQLGSPSNTQLEAQLEAWVPSIDQLNKSISMFLVIQSALVYSEFHGLASVTALPGFCFCVYGLGRAIMEARQMRVDMPAP